MKLRRGKTQNLLEGSIDAALLAVEAYNRPRKTFRSQAYIVLMIIAWTRLFHAYFNKRYGNRYYYKDNRGRYKLINGERRAWELTTCIKRFENYKKLSEPVKANLRFFVGLRNKIEHRNVAEREVDTSIFGECQSLLYNYESVLIDVFGSQYAINTSLAFSLQFSYMRTKEQQQAGKRVMSAELQEIRDYIEIYRSNLSAEVFNSQEYSIKLIQIPRISNTNRNDLALDFVMADELDPERYSQITGIVKNKLVFVEAKNAGKILPGKVVEKVNETTRREISLRDHMYLYSLFSVRPPWEDSSLANTNTRYCHYDEANNKFLFQESWVEFIVGLFEIHGLTKAQIRQAYNDGEKWEIDKFS